MFDATAFSGSNYQHKCLFISPIDTTNSKQLLRGEYDKL
jgi:hypothetical protein